MKRLRNNMLMEERTSESKINQLAKLEKNNKTKLFIFSNGIIGV